MWVLLEISSTGCKSKGTAGTTIFEGGGVHLATAGCCNEGLSNMECCSKIPVCCYSRLLAISGCLNFVSDFGPPN